MSKDRQAGVLVFNQKKHINIPALTGQFYVVSMIVLFRCQTAYADIFDTAKSAMQQVYTDVAGIATVGAVVCAAVCLFLMNFSKSGKTVDESRAWLKAYYYLLGRPNDSWRYCNLYGKYYSKEYVFCVTIWSV